MQKENLFFFSFPNESTFDEVKGTKISIKWEQNKWIYFVEHEKSYL